MIGYMCGAYDILRAKDLQELDRNIQINKERGNKLFALGVYDNELCKALEMDTPLKDIEDRMKIMEQISGVDFVFKVSTKDEKVIFKKLEQAYEVYMENKKNIKNEQEKIYNIAYVPGTYDLFHLGHLENILEAHKLSKQIIVGVKADELVEKHKQRKPIISEDERVEILRHFKIIDSVYKYYTRDPHVANDWIKSRFGKEIDAIFMGEDLREDFKNINDLNFVFTNRDKNMIKQRSTTAYRKKLHLAKIPEEPIEYTGKIDKTVDIFKEIQEKDTDNIIGEK